MVFSDMKSEQGVRTQETDQQSRPFLNSRHCPQSQLLRLALTSSQHQTLAVRSGRWTFENMNCTRPLFLKVLFLNCRGDQHFGPMAFVSTVCSSCWTLKIQVALQSCIILIVLSHITDMCTRTSVWCLNCHLSISSEGRLHPCRQISGRIYLLRPAILIPDN